MKNRLNRFVFGAFIGLLGGVSFGVTILPMAAEQFLDNLTNSHYLAMAQLAIPASLLWAPSGGLTGMWGGIRQGFKVMSIGGLLAGLIYGLMISGMGNLPLVGLSGIVGALYGAGAGLLVGAGLPSPEDDIDEEKEAS